MRYGALLLVIAGCAAGGDADTVSATAASSGSGGAAGCTPGQQEACYGGSAEHAGVGMCARGLRHCQLDSATPTWGPCLDWVAPGAESCDRRALDEDCDGSANEDCACRDGETMACGSAEGECEPGVQTCVNGRWAACRGGVGPVAESCSNNADDDCDGDSDCDDGDCATTCNANCGNGLCESGETPTSCPCDCSGCTSNLDCGGMTPECCIPCGCNGPALQCVTPSNCCG